MKCFNQESVLHVRLEQTVQDRAVGIERRFIRQVAHGVPVPQELQLGRNSSSCSQKRSSTGKNGSTGSTAEKSPGPSVGVPPSRATACRSRSIRPEKCCAAGGVTEAFSCPCSVPACTALKLSCEHHCPARTGETVRIAQQVIGRHGRAEGRRHPDAVVLPLGRAVRTGKAQRLMQKLQIEIGLIAPQGESSRDGIEILRGEAAPCRLRLQIIVGKVSYRFHPFSLSKSPAAAGDQTRKGTLTVSFHTFLPLKLLAWLVF